MNLIEQIAIFSVAFTRCASYYLSTLKMKRYYLFVLITLLNIEVNAQPKNHIEKAYELSIATPTDTLNIRELSNLITTLTYLDVDTARYFAQKVLDLSQQEGYVPGKIRALSQHGFILTNQHRFVEAIDYYLQSIELANSYGKSIDLIVVQRNAIAGIYRRLHDYENAEKLLNQSLQQVDSMQDFSHKYYTYFGSALLYRDLDEFERSNTFFNLAKHLAVEHNQLIKASRVINQIGRNFYFQEQYDSAIVYMEEAMKIRVDSNASHWILTSERDLGMVYAALDNPDKALELLRLSLEKSSTIGLPFSSLPTLKNIGFVYEQQKNYEQASSHLLKAYHVATEIHDTKEMTIILGFLIENLNKDKKFNEAQKYFTVYDSLVTMDSSDEELAAMEAKYQLELKAMELNKKNELLEVLNQKEKSERNFMAAMVTALILLLISLLLLYARYVAIRSSRSILSHKNSLIETQKREIATMNETLEKRLLRAQMNPHFIFNALNSIQHFITISDKKSALNYLSKFSRLIRQTLEHSLISWVPISEELLLLKNYIELELLRFNNSFDYHIELDESLDIETVEIPFLIIQPYVENAINHGIHSLDKRGKLHIKIIDRDTQVICIIEDNGIGRKAANAIKSYTRKTSRGMSLTQRRLSLLNKDYKNAATVEIDDLENQAGAAGTRVMITMSKRRLERIPHKTDKTIENA